jgi:NadR type nicotinamide-nucleotide adenylyltransferase
MEKIPQQRAFSGFKIVLFGPESTGKSTLARQLTRYFETLKADEFARDYLQAKFDQTGKSCEYTDLIPIAVGQRKAENKAAKKATGYLFCDTDALETYVYSKVYFSKVPAAIEDAARKSDYALYLLMNVDVPWTPDDLRDKPKDREKMFQHFETELVLFQKQYIIINGIGEERFNNAIDAIQKLKDQ